MVVYILFFSKTNREEDDRNVFGIYKSERTAYSELTRLENTGRFNCSVLSTPLID
jgi:hypothetical protein